MHDLLRARSFSFLALIAVAALGFGCAAVDESASAGDDTDDSEESLENKGSQKWIYAGMLPALEGPSVTISLKGHTARVTGRLPEGHTAELPFYVERGEGRDVSVVYPIATGTSAKAPGHYPELLAIPYVPNTDVSWGGFPFLKYHMARGLAMHGPITSKDGEWQLIRGPVSHGCNRMQGEHVVEVTHLLGIDMTVPHTATGEKLPVPVDVIETYDTLDGGPIDVDFPAHAKVVRPTGPTVKMFRTWDSRDFPQWVCGYDKKRPLGEDHCDYMAASVLDPLTGVAPVGSPCGDVTFEGQCEGNLLQYCDGTLEVVQCSAASTCGWDTEKKFFNCL